LLALSNPTLIASSKLVGEAPMISETLATRSIRWPPHSCTWWDIR